MMGLVVLVVCFFLCILFMFGWDISSFFVLELKAPV